MEGYLIRFGHARAGLPYGRGVSTAYGAMLETFPPGTILGIYPRQAMRPGAMPAGQPIATAEVTEDGVELEVAGRHHHGAPLVAYGRVAGHDRYVAFRTRAESGERSRWRTYPSP